MNESLEFALQAMSKGTLYLGIALAIRNYLTYSASYDAFREQEVRSAAVKKATKELELIDEKDFLSRNVVYLGQAIACERFLSELENGSSSTSW